MTQTNQASKKILIVCAANYCRSPVAENLLQYYHKEFIFDSAGIFGFNEIGMDPRSVKFLKKMLNSFSFHNQKTIEKKLVDSNDLIYAIDFKILMDLNKLFPRSSQKFQLFGLKNENILITDPYKMNDMDYEKIMDKINYISKNIRINL